MIPLRQALKICVEALRGLMTMVTILGIGLITPTVGAVLFVGAAIGKVNIESTVKALLSFYAALFAVLMAVAYIPMISLWLPSVVL